MNTIGQQSARRPRLFISSSPVPEQFCSSSQWDTVTKLLIGWNVTVWSYLALVGWLDGPLNHVRSQHCGNRRQRRRHHPDNHVDCRDRQSLQPSSSSCRQPRTCPWAIAWLTTRLRVLPCSAHGAWSRRCLLFPLCADLLRSANRTPRNFQFPDNEANPDYWDFLYFSYTIAVAAQDLGHFRDVTVHAKDRTLHNPYSVSSSTSPSLALSINIAASLVGA